MNLRPSVELQRTPSNHPFATLITLPQTDWRHEPATTVIDPAFAKPSSTPSAFVCVICQFAPRSFCARFGCDTLSIRHP